MKTNGRIPEPPDSEFNPQESTLGKTLGDGIIDREAEKGEHAAENSKLLNLHQQSIVAWANWGRNRRN